MDNSEEKNADVPADPPVAGNARRDSVPDPGSKPDAWAPAKQETQAPTGATHSAPQTEKPEPAAQVTPPTDQFTQRADQSAPPADQPAPATPEITPPIDQPKSPTDQPSPEIAMEVHHHPDLHHQKKPWKEYLIEGFMIFIAVMMGFIAENIREDITNNHHARELTTQLVADLKADTTRLNQVIDAQTKILQTNDSLIALLQQPLATADLDQIQRLIIKSHNLWEFHPAGGAIGAIKNELHLRQFAHSELITYIAEYEGGIELLHTVQDIYLQYQHNMLDAFLREHFTPGNLLAAFDHKPLPDAQMRNLTQAGLTQLATDMVLVRVVSAEIVRDDVSVKENAVNLLKYTISAYDHAKD